MIDPPSPDPRDRDQSVMPPPSWGLIVAAAILCAAALPAVGLIYVALCVAEPVADRLDRWLVKRGYPT